MDANTEPTVVSLSAAPKSEHELKPIYERLTATQQRLDKLIRDASDVQWDLDVIGTILRTKMREKR
jgi:hypothetical protein